MLCEVQVWMHEEELMKQSREVEDEAKKYEKDCFLYFGVPCFKWLRFSAGQASTWRHMHGDICTHEQYACTDTLDALPTVVHFLTGFWMFGSVQGVHPGRGGKGQGQFSTSCLRGAVPDSWRYMCAHIVLQKCFLHIWNYTYSRHRYLFWQEEGFRFPRDGSSMSIFLAISLFDIVFAVNI